MKIDENVLLWLLEENNPSVPYFTLTELIGRSEKDSEVIETKNQIMEKKPVIKILSQQLKTPCI